MSLRRVRHFDNELVRCEVEKARIRTLVHRTALFYRFCGHLGYVFILSSLFVLFYKFRLIVDRCQSNRKLVEKYFLRRRWNTAILQVFYNSSRKSRASMRRRRKTVEIKFI
ncbi:hypothetical protein QR680_009785 [Steinernema hermaphroditum]|uniref:Uncharacterized protein n=1 Tax=Steinernema hermaphroditum TaxID=289476 RepID=A0AA39M9I8_9BILA|nr:hypothetical protein QR680_009785 [Steinernema hermaphroditum]